MLVNRRTIHIEWGDCDPAGIVYFPRFFEYFDACTNALFERAGLPKHEMIEKYQILGIPLVEARASFIVPSRFGDNVVVESCVTEWGKSSFSVQHKLFRGETLAVEGFERRVWTVRAPGDPKRIYGQAIPREVIERFTKPATK
jgi:4-hydroxybenzoyl-CoA thioesterase